MLCLFLWVRVSSQGLGTCLTSLKMLAGDKRSSLLCRSVDDEEGEFFNIVVRMWSTIWTWPTDSWDPCSDQAQDRLSSPHRSSGKIGRFDKIGNTVLTKKRFVYFSDRYDVSPDRGVQGLDDTQYDNKQNAILIIQCHYSECCYAECHPSRYSQCFDKPKRDFPSQQLGTNVCREIG